VAERRRAAQDVPASLAYRILDADHLRTERREELRRTGAGELSGEVTDADVGQRTAGHAEGVACHGSRTRRKALDAPVGSTSVALGQIVQATRGIDQDHAALLGSTVRERPLDVLPR